MSFIETLRQPEFSLKLIAGNEYEEVQFVNTGKRLQLYFNYNEILLNDVKTSLEGRKAVYADDKTFKCWEVPISPRNVFRLAVMAGKYSTLKPYARFDKLDTESRLEQIKAYCKERGITPYNHQYDLINQALIVNFFIWAAEMGLGKTLAAIIVMEMSGIKNWYWVAPRSVLVSVEADFDRWRSKVWPTFMTYEGLKKTCKEWKSGNVPPEGIIFDEASKLKTPSSERTLAARHITTAMRIEHDQPFIGLLSGTPAPKAPTDWFSLCEVACPGFIKEGNINDFKRRLALTEKKETTVGTGYYEQIISWLDDENKCAICGQFINHANHSATATRGHRFKKSINQVAGLSKRLRGLVNVKIKNECLDLPEKRYEVINVEASSQIKNLANLIMKTSNNALDALIRCRELSDGFQYKDEPTGKTRPCSLCYGEKKLEVWYDQYGELLSFHEVETKKKILNEDGDTCDVIPEKHSIECTGCNGEGTVPELHRTLITTECPKDQVLRDLLERHEEAGRLNVYAGFTASVDRCAKTAMDEGWNIVRVDGRGWHGFSYQGQPLGLSEKELYQRYTQGDRDELFAFIGNAGTAGMGLTLTCSPSTFFFSNDFNGENRMQAEDRGHRIGMDVVRGGLIIDVVHLKTDLKILESHRRKKNLQYLTMKGLQSLMGTI